jgi:peptidoglycan pentaglycine glycine transferase (the first glycine)
MQIITLTEQQFDNYAITHPNRCFYQSSSYGKLMSNHGFSAHYIGYIDDNNKIKAGALIIYKKIFANYKMAYAPRGFLIDYNDKRMVEDFTNQLKKLLRKQQFIFIKIDPFIEYAKRNIKGELITKENKNIITYLEKLGYIHMGLNKNFETLKPRNNAIITLNTSVERLFNSLDKSLRSKIRNATKKGVTIYKGDKDTIKDIYPFISKNNSRELNYYYDYYDIFNQKNMIDIYYASINPTIYLENAKKAYDEELLNNNYLTDQLQNIKIKNKDIIINKKMESDKKN